MSNVLLRLASRLYRAKPKSLLILDNVDIFPVNIIIISEGFRRRLLENY